MRFFARWRFIVVKEFSLKRVCLGLTINLLIQYFNSWQQNTTNFLNPIIELIFKRVWAPKWECQNVKKQECQIFFLFDHLILHLELYYFFELCDVGDCLPRWLAQPGHYLNLMLQTMTGYQLQVCVCVCLCACRICE